tara:strand:+ start:544 stop:1095 length:552 start_codon:yes stop_codon:yes gene_type:complete
MPKYKLFKSGKETFIERRREDEGPFGLIFNKGAGEYMDDSFDDLVEAKDYCNKIIKEDPSTVFYIMIGEKIVDSVLDSAWHESEDRKSDYRYNIYSGMVVLFIATVISIAVMKFDMIAYHFIFSFGFTLLYLFLNRLNDRGSIDGLVVILILLILASISKPAIEKALELKHKAEQVDEHNDGT